MIKNDLPEGCEQVSPLLDVDLPNERIRFRYRNWEGKEAVRSVLPQRMFLGTSKWHPGVQLLMLAVDLDRSAPRCFAVRDIIEFLPAEEETSPTIPKPSQAPPVTEPSQERVRLFQDPGSGRLVHNGLPSWRATRQAVADLDNQVIILSRSDNEVGFHTDTGHAIAGVSCINDRWMAIIDGFEFWAHSEKEGRETYQSFINPPSREAGEEMVTTILRQAGAIIP